MAINKNKVVTFNDLEQYAGISVDPSINLTGNIISELGGLGNLIYFKGFIDISQLNVSSQQAMKYVYFGYVPITSFYYDNTSESIIMNVSLDKSGHSKMVKFPAMHIGNVTYWAQIVNPVSLSEIKNYITTNVGTSKIIYSTIASLADDDMVNDIWIEYNPIIDPSTGEPMKDENGNILYEEGEYYAETRKRGEPILL